MTKELTNEVVVVGGNAAGVIWKAIEEIESIDKDIAELKTDQGEVRKGLKKKDLPLYGLGQMMARAAKDEEKIAEQLEEVALAGTLLDIKIPTRFDRPRSTSHLTKEAVSAFKNAFTSLQRLKGEVSELTADRREKMKTLKSEGYSPYIVERIIKYRRNPVDMKENDILFDTYMSAIKPFADKAEKASIKKGRS